jgi:hypothetical protein
MTSFFTACLAAIVLAFVGLVALNAVQQTSEHAYNVTGAKL